MEGKTSEGTLAERLLELGKTAFDPSGITNVKSLKLQEYEDLLHK
jgi:hypothetical protein